MLGALRVRGEVPAQVNKAADVVAGVLKKSGWLVTTIADGTNFIWGELSSPAVFLAPRFRIVFGETVMALPGLLHQPTCWSLVWRDHRCLCCHSSTIQVEKSIRLEPEAKLMKTKEFSSYLLELNRGFFFLYLKKLGMRCCLAKICKNGSQHYYNEPWSSLQNGSDYLP